MSKFLEKQVLIRGIKINYAEAGKGKVLVFIHGATNSWKSFLLVGKRLSNRYRVILVDLPGYGKSGRLDKYSLEIEADLVDKIISVLGLKKCFLVGDSMGAAVVAKFLQKYPKKAKGAVLMGTIFRGKDLKKQNKFLRKITSTAKERRFWERWVKKVVSKDIYSYITSRFYNMYNFDKRLVKKYVIGGKKGFSGKAYIQMGREMTRLSITKLLSGCKIPVCFVCGKYDKVSNCSLARERFEGKGRYTFAEIDKAGHIVSVENPKKVAEKIDGFVQRVGVEPT